MLDCHEWSHHDRDEIGGVYPSNPLPNFNNRLILQQFTGLKDKNKKDIYEGDILKIIHTHNKNKFDPFIEFLEVKWDYYSDGEYVDKIECWMADHDSLSELLYRTTCNLEWKLDIEIVGNIFENLDLLK
jgi:uncharacterized phage protein (TIGR01671 family)